MEVKPSFLLIYLLIYMLTYLLTHSLTYLFTYLLTPWNRVFLEKLAGFQLVKKYPAFMEPKVSFSYSQVPATCPYPEPDQSSPPHPNS